LTPRGGSAGIKLDLGADLRDSIQPFSNHAVFQFSVKDAEIDKQPTSATNSPCIAGLDALLLITCPSHAIFCRWVSPVLSKP
jgi:hypothetical protein